MQDAMLKRTCGDVMNASVSLVGADQPVLDALDLMRRRHIGAAIVIREGRICGIFTERDIVLRVGRAAPTRWELPVAEVMTQNPEVLRAEDSVVWALNRMAVGGFRHVPIVDEDNRPIGMVSARDIVRMFAEFFPEDVYNLPPRPVTYLPMDGG